MLPDGSALVLGGSQDNLDRDCVRAAELYDPGSGRWSTGAAAAVPRQYHSVALLMPDGRVWTAGSNHDGKQSFRNDPANLSDAEGVAAAVRKSARWMVWSRLSEKHRSSKQGERAIETLGERVTSDPFLKAKLLAILTKLKSG